MRGGHNKRCGDNKNYEKKCWKDKEFYKCGEKVYPEYHLTKTKKDKNNYDKITRSTSSRASMKKIANYFKKMSRAFATVNTQL